MENLLNLPFQNRRALLFITQQLKWIWISVYEGTKPCNSFPVCLGACWGFLMITSARWETTAFWSRNCMPGFCNVFLFCFVGIWGLGNEDKGGRPSKGARTVTGVFQLMSEILELLVLPWQKFFLGEMIRVHTMLAFVVGCLSGSTEHFTSKKWRVLR